MLRKTHGYKIQWYIVICLGSILAEVLLFTTKVLQFIYYFP